MQKNAKRGFVEVGGMGNKDMIVINRVEEYEGASRKQNQLFTSLQ